MTSRSNPKLGTFTRRSLGAGGRNPEQFRGRPRNRGFTLIEVLIAMGIFLGAMLAILGIYFQNLRLARMAREEIIISMIQRGIMARNQVVASARAGHERSWKRGVPGAETPPSFDEFGSPRDGTTYGIGGDETAIPDDALDFGWGIRNTVTWEKSSGLHWGRWSKQQAIDAGYADIDAAEADRPSVPLYENFFFIAHPVWRYVNDPATPWIRKPFEPASEAEWDPTTTTGHPGLALEDSQFTDWDGYGMVDMDRDGFPETNRGAPYPSPGPIHPSVPADFPGGSNTYANNPYRIFYNSDKMGYYFMRIRVRIMWQVKDLDDVYNKTDAEVLEAESGLVAGVPTNEPRRVFNHTEYYFSVINPDIVKRWQP
jgi:prepilin-type N-terminal cleavage/methylation domain-containing protein